MACDILNHSILVPRVGAQIKLVRGTIVTAAAGIYQDQEWTGGGGGLECDILNHTKERLAVVSCPAPPRMCEKEGLVF